MGTVYDSITIFSQGRLIGRLYLYISGVVQLFRWTTPFLCDNRGKIVNFVYDFRGI